MGSARLFWSAPCGAALAVLAVAVSGCGPKPDYPPNLSFPSRADRLILKSPEGTPTHSGEPGKIDEEIAHLDEIGGKTADPRSATTEQRAAMDAFLKASFGTPAAPGGALPSDESTSARVEHLGLTPDALASGGKLFRQHCLQCHNINGDGRGTAGLWVMPYPRDYRRGVFKFVTTGDTGKPRRADLVRTITDGLKGTAMPSFGLLSEHDRDLLARYVTFLSIRGQVEFETFAAILTGTTTDVPGFADGRVKAVVAEWERIEAAPAPPQPPNDGAPGSSMHQAAVKRGYDLFTRKADNACINCHGDFGRKPVLRFDIWGTVAKPANLVANEPAFKGGGRPEDIYARIRGGIRAVGMPAHPELVDRQVWDLVRFVKSAANPLELPLDVRNALYPNAGDAP